MLTIRDEQMRALDEAHRKAFVEDLAADLDSRYASRLPESEQISREDIAQWEQDARRWGLRRPDSIADYVESCVVTRVIRPDLEGRLATFLHVYHEDLAAGVDVEPFAREVVATSRAFKIADEEAVAWLAVIVLSGRRRGFVDDRWLRDILGQPGLDDPARLQRAHDEAIKRGWIAGKAGRE